MGAEYKPAVWKQFGAEGAPAAGGSAAGDIADGRGGGKPEVGAGCGPGTAVEEAAEGGAWPEVAAVSAAAGGEEEEDGAAAVGKPLRFY